MTAVVADAAAIAIAADAAATAVDAAAIGAEEQDFRSVSRAFSSTA
jgi:hypothetical protein